LNLYKWLVGTNHGRYYGSAGKSLFARLEFWYGRMVAMHHPGAKAKIARSARISPDALISGDVTIGEETAILPYAILRARESQMRIGAHCTVNPFSCIFAGAIIGDHVRIGTHTIIIPANHGFERTDVPIHGQPGTAKGIRINDDVWIGANVTILDGVTIGTGVVIGAGTVVTKSVPDRAIVVGNPGRVLRYRGEKSVSEDNEDKAMPPGGRTMPS
jgi:carbonic anhydrase/acetyltransferase-like protein (isoleucine patch superfamily)